MGFSRTVMLLPAVALTGWTMGCAQTRLADVPMHELNLSDSGRSSRLVLPRQARVDRPEAKPVKPMSARRAWRHIVIHHSATDGGNAEIFDALHRGPGFGFDELGYHFVITNGRGGPDGLVEVGSRWHKQKWGAHCGGTPNNEYNDYGIGICLVGDFTGRMPTRAQLVSLENLVVRLMAEYDIPPENVIGHRDAPNAATECPGRLMSNYLAGTFRSAVSNRLIAAKAGAGSRQ